MISRRRLIALSASAVVLAGAGSAFATWSHITQAGPVIGSVEQLSAPSMTAPTTGTQTTSAVTVAWTQSKTTVTNTAATSYTVTRYKLTGITPDGGSAACGGIQTALTCQDTVPSDGSYAYSVTANYKSWTKTTAANSGTVTTVTTDTTPPAVSITSPTNNGSYNATGWAAGCTPAGICGTASDSTGVASVAVSIRQGTGNYWNGTGFSSITEVKNAASGTTSWKLPLAAASLTDGATYSVRAYATDTATPANTTPSPTLSAFTYDSSAPAAPVGLKLATSSDTGSSNSDGITKNTTPTFTGTAEKSSTVAIFAGTTQIASGTADASTGAFSAAVAAAKALSDGTYTITAKATDAAGNTSTAATLATSLVIDTAAPATPTGTYTDGNNGQGDKITGNAERSSVVTAQESGSGTGSFTGSASSTNGTYSISVHNIGSGNYSYAVTATDAAGNQSSALTISGTDTT